MVTSGISQSDIARRAAVGRAAVSNWRARHADFPPPNGGTRRSPTFDAEAVDRWLASHLTGGDAQPVLPRREAVSAPPPPLAEPLLNLLDRAGTRRPGVWLLHEDIVDNGVATAPLIRRLAANGDIERTRISFPTGARVLIRSSHSDDTVDTRGIEQQANAILAAVAHHVTIYPARNTISNYRPVKVIYRGTTYTGYLRARSWNVTIEENP